MGEGGWERKRRSPSASQRLEAALEAMDHRLHAEREFHVRALPPQNRRHARAHDRWAIAVVVHRGPPELVPPSSSTLCSALLALFLTLRIGVGIERARRQRGVHQGGGGAEELQPVGGGRGGGAQGQGDPAAHTAR